VHAHIFLVAVKTGASHVLVVFVHSYFFFEGGAKETDRAESPAVPGRPPSSRNRDRLHGGVSHPRSPGVLPLAVLLQAGQLHVLVLVAPLRERLE
jgi:hypothetical protein